MELSERNEGFIEEPSLFLVLNLKQNAIVAYALSVFLGGTH